MAKIEACYPLEEGEILHEAQTSWPLFVVTIHGSARERVKLAKRLVSAETLTMIFEKFINEI